MEASSILRAVKSFAPVFGHHPTAVWDAARDGAQKAAEFLPENLAPVKTLVRKHPVLATCAVLALGGLLSARSAAALTRA
jgi:hypothetical protein